MLADLHLHTTASDGIISPEKLVTLVQQAKIAAFAVTDHDTVQAVPVIQYLLKDTELIFIPGIEINTYCNGEEYHILGYNIDCNNKVLNRVLKEIREGRAIRMHKMVGQLQMIGLPVTMEDILLIANGESLCRPHLATLLLQKGVVTSIDEAFARYLTKGQVGYVSRKTLSPPDAVELIHNAGGIAVLAHPGRIRQQLTSDFLRSLSVDGLEVLHPDHDTATTLYLKKLVKEERLLATGGSDFHGYPRQTSWSESISFAEIGSQQVPLEWAKQLLIKKGAHIHETR